MSQQSFNNHPQQQYYQDPNASYPQDQVNTFGGGYDQSEYQSEEYYETQEDNNQYYYDEHGQVQYADSYSNDPNQSYYNPPQQQQQQYNNNQYQQHPPSSNYPPQNVHPPLPSKSPHSSAPPPLPGRGTPSARGGPPGRGPRGAPPPRRAPKKSGGILGYVNKGIDATMKTASKTTQQISTASNGKPTDDGAKRWEEAALGERLAAEFPAKLLTHNKAMQGSICISPSWFAFLPVAKQNPNVILSWMDIDRIIENHKSKQKGNYAPVFTAQEKTEKKVNAFIVTTFSGASYQLYGFKMAYKTAVGSITGTMNTAKRRGGAPAPVPAPLPNKTLAPHPVKQAPSFPSRVTPNSNPNPPLPNKSVGGAPPPLPSKGGTPQQPYYSPQNDQSYYQQPHDPYQQVHHQPQNYNQTPPHNYQAGHFATTAPPLSPPNQQQYGQQPPPQLPPHNPGYSHPPQHHQNPSYPPQQFNPPPLPPKR